VSDRLAMPNSPTRKALLIGALLATLAASVQPASARGPTLPEIRLAPGQVVPACVTPGRLNRHLMERTRNLDPRFRDIARYYKQHGEALHIRWDYAFYQMLLETNYLSYKTGSGRWGDVDPKQNNFAGIGTTGGGVPGDSFPDVSSGVLAQMQHLVAYSGERVSSPLARRTREKQDEIIELSLALRRHVRFDDLTNRWAADRNYATSIEWVADGYRKANCTATGEPLRPSDDDLEEQRSRRPRIATLAGASTQGAPRIAAAAAQRPHSCDVYSASYGGQVALLIRSEAGASVAYTVLQVETELEEPQADAFIRAYAPNGQTIARFPSPGPAFVRAFELCPGPS
jgi:hypothetical protein